MENIVRNEILKDLPDTRGFAARGSLFGGFDAGGGISIDIQSSDPEATRAAAKLGFKLLNKKFPKASINPQPSLEYDQPEFRLVAQRPRHHGGGLEPRDVGNLVQAFGEGLYVGQRYDGDQRLFMILKSKPLPSSDAGLQRARRHAQCRRRTASANLSR